MSRLFAKSYGNLLTSMFGSLDQPKAERTRFPRPSSSPGSVGNVTWLKGCKHAVFHHKKTAVLP